MNYLWMLAQAGDTSEPSGITSEPIDQQGEAITTVPSDPNDVTPKVQRKPFGPQQWIFLALMFVVMYLILFRGPKKKQQQHKQMVQTLEKNDRVRTIGGIIGTVVDIKDDEITLKIDESNNTKMKVVSSAIGKNLSKE